MFTNQCRRYHLTNQCRNHHYQSCCPYHHRYSSLVSVPKFDAERTLRKFRTQLRVSDDLTRVDVNRNEIHRRKLRRRSCGADKSIAPRRDSSPRQSQHSAIQLDVARLCAPLMIAVMSDITHVDVQQTLSDVKCADSAHEVNERQNGL